MRQLTLSTHDLYGNRCTQGGAEVALSLRPRDVGEDAAGSVAGSVAGTVAGSVTDAGDGSYSPPTDSPPGSYALA